MPVFVSWNTLHWLPVGIESFREHFPSWQILVVDNNPTEGTVHCGLDHEAERRWLNEQEGLIVLPHQGSQKTHGAAVDLAVEWCREHHVEYLLHVEPDCLVSGTEWFRRLCEAIDSGAWMAGSHRKLYGPVHPTPSLWRLSQLKTSFEICPRGEDENHPRFAELFDKPWLIDAVSQAQLNVDFWQENWDTGQRAWFQCAMDDKAAYVPETEDFHHFWQASQVSPEQRALAHPPLRGFLENRQTPTTVAVAAGDVANRLRSQLLDTFRMTEATNAVWFGRTRSSAPEDLLLALGQTSALMRAGINIVASPFGPELTPADDVDTVFLSGGIGTGIDSEEERRFHLRCCEYYSGKRIIWLPQRIDDRNGRLVEEHASHLLRRGDIRIWVNDAVSLAQAGCMGLDDVVLVPDGIFGLQQSPAVADELGPCRFIPRCVRNSSSLMLSYTDWLLPGASLPHDEREAWDHVTRCLDGSRIVVTDRLHVHFLCVICDIPNILVCESNAGNRSAFQTWTHVHPCSRLAKNWEDALQMVEALPSPRG